MAKLSFDVVFRLNEFRPESTHHIVADIDERYLMEYSVDQQKQCVNDVLVTWFEKQGIKEPGSFDIKNTQAWTDSDEEPGSFTD